MTAPPSYTKRPFTPDGWVKLKQWAITEFGNLQRSIAGLVSVAVLTGDGTPEGNVAAPPGTLYTSTAGGANVTLWVKESGTAKTGWAAK